MATNKIRKKKDQGSIATKEVIDSRRLLYFYHVARTKSFSVAETVLNVAQSAISRQIQQLEADLDATLLERTGRGITLTQFGEILYEQASTILGEMSSTVDRLNTARRRPSGQITFAGFASAMEVLMPEVLRRFMKIYPDVELTAVQATTGEVYDLLATGEVDVAILSQTYASKNLLQHKLMVDPMVLVAASDLPLAKQPYIKLSDLDSINLILPASQHGLRVLIEKYCEDGGIKLSSRIRVDSTPLMKSLVRSGEFCTILPQMAFRPNELNAAGLCTIPFKPKFSRILSVACLRDRAESPLIATLMREVVAVCREYAINDLQDA